MSVSVIDCDVVKTDACAGRIDVRNGITGCKGVHLDHTGNLGSAAIQSCLHRRAGCRRRAVVGSGDRVDGRAAVAAHSGICAIASKDYRHIGPAVAVIAGGVGVEQGEYRDGRRGDIGSAYVRLLQGIELGAGGVDRNFGHSGGKGDALDIRQSLCGSDRMDGNRIGGRDLAAAADGCIAAFVPGDPADTGIGLGPNLGVGLIDVGAQQRHINAAVRLRGLRSCQSVVDHADVNGFGIDVVRSPRHVGREFTGSVCIRIDRTDAHHGDAAAGGDGGVGDGIALCLNMDGSGSGLESCALGICSGRKVHVRNGGIGQDCHAADGGAAGLAGRSHDCLGRCARVPHIEIGQDLHALCGFDVGILDIGLLQAGQRSGDIVHRHGNAGDADCRNLIDRIGFSGSVRRNGDLVAICGSGNHDDAAAADAAGHRGRHVGKRDIDFPAEHAGIHICGRRANGRIRLRVVLIVNLDTLGIDVLSAVVHRGVKNALCVGIHRGDAQRVVSHRAAFQHIRAGIGGTVRLYRDFAHAACLRAEACTIGSGHVDRAGGRNRGVHRAGDKTDLDAGNSGSVAAQQCGGAAGCILGGIRQIKGFILIQVGCNIHRAGFFHRNSADERVLIG